METSNPSNFNSLRKPKVAVVGCAARNTADLNCMAAPRKYRKLGDFHKYYSGEAIAPVLTLVIGGNHEASNYLFELYHGGWLAPNIYYLGAAGVIRYGPWRIAGMSGIYKQQLDYLKPHHERLPYKPDQIRSIYHVRENNVQRLLQIRSQVDIGLSHDWPTWVELFGDHASLFATKPAFFSSAKIDNLGSKPAAEVMNHLRPPYWFSGHMHIRFNATVEYKNNMSLEESVKALPVPEKIRESLPVFQAQPESHTSSSLTTSSLKPAGSQPKTEFLGLHKPSAHARLFMELRELELPARPNTDDARFSIPNDEGKFSLYYDEEWLAITRAYADTLRLGDPKAPVVRPAESRRSASASLPQHRSWVKANIVNKDLLKVPEHFTTHAPVHYPDVPETFKQPAEYPNQQTARFTELLQIHNHLQLAWF
ncbi:hypothetical protein G7Z17_g10316 [Cylindrodendrum hubeiense]|uniref:Lariat debranching enzyme C-terminal domain-containing protein n=1 Tax=Cylindrodendrum hubeiense TaxID=595255 RepID=A0A9P5H526_9HYPO|nr:hypothetical protein G7Z17_g10316 [Cylindrodendrum hubeiense]